MSSRHKRIYHKRSKAKHVICVSCNALLKFDHGQKLYRQRYPLTNRLQDRRWDPSLKPGISILEGLIETIPELAVGDVSHFLSAMYICHECYILLRQVVNYKFKVQNRLVEFQKNVADVTTEMRLETNKQAKETGKITKCWACQQRFTKDGTRFAMHRCIAEELTVKEAIESVLPDETVTLQESSQKHMMLCETCFKMLTKIITVQCQAETARQSFMERTNENSLISKIQEQGDDFDTFDDYALDADSVDVRNGYNDDNDDDEFDDTMSESLDVSAAEPSGNIIVISAETALPTEEETSDFHQEKIETQSIDDLTGSSAHIGRKRKLSQSDFEAHNEASSEADTEGSFQDVSFVKQENDFDENYDEHEEKRRRMSSIDVLSILQSASSHSEELQIAESVDMENEDLEGGSSEERAQDSLSENILKKVIYYLQKDSLHKALKVLQKNCIEFENEIQKLIRDHVKKEIFESNDLEKSDWSKLCSLHSGHVTVESFIKAFQEHLPFLSSVLSCSISGQNHLDFTKLEKKSLLRLLTVMGIIAFERNPSCNVIQCLNSIQMAEDGCTSELYNSFFGLGLCLKEKETQELLSAPDYCEHQVCWDLLKEAQVKTDSAARKTDRDKAKDVDSLSGNDDNDDDDSVPDDFADVCPYWKLPPENTPVKEGSTASAEWVLYTDPKDPSAADMIRLIFAEADVAYQECSEPYDTIEVVGGRQQEYPALSPPIVRKGHVTLTQGPVICRHLGEMFGLCPESAEDQLHAEQICHACHDFLLEGRLLYQEFDQVEKVPPVKEAAVSPMEKFIKTKIPRFLGFLETALQANISDKRFFFGKQLSYVDLAVYHTLRSIEQRFPEILKQAKHIPQLQTFRERLSVQPTLRAFIDSEKSKGKVEAGS